MLALRSPHQRSPHQPSPSRRVPLLAAVAAVAVALTAGTTSAATPRSTAEIDAATVAKVASAVALDTPSSVPDDRVAKVDLSRVSRDPYANTSAYHRTELEPDTYAWDDTIVAVFQTGRYPDGGSTNTGFATSVDGGSTWTHGFMPRTTGQADPPGPYARISDPVIGYDAKHDVWLANSLTVDAKNSLIVNRSVDGGLTWSKPVVVSTPTGSSDYDKNWIACDNWTSSPHYGNCYVQVDDFGLGNLMSMFTSSDGGKTWSEADVASASGLGGQPVAQPDGTVIVPFSANFGGVESLVSEDGGESYDGPFQVATTIDGSPPFMRAPPLPSAEVDGNGRVYVVWQDCRFRDGCSSNDIVMSTSKDGENWTAVQRIPIDGVGSTVDHFTPGIGVDVSSQGASARLALTYYYFPTNDCSFDSCRLFAGYVSSTDAGSHWSEPKQVLGPLKLNWLPDAGGRFVGDYISTSFMNDRAFPVIANARRGDCTLGQIRSCHEFMVAPTNGLSVTGGTLPIGVEPVLTDTRSGPAWPAFPRTF